MTNASRLSVVLAMVCSGCAGGGGGGAPDFGQYELASLDEDCEGVAGLSGSVAWNAANEHYDAELGYITAAGGRVDLTDLDIDLTLPAEPVAVCYPEFTGDTGAVTGPRVAIVGVDMAFVTADGQFDENLDAKLWTTTNAGFPQPPIVLAVTTRGALDGDWEPFPDYEPISKNMSFVTALTGSSSTFTGGNVGGGHADRHEYDAAIFSSQFALATW